MGGDVVEHHFLREGRVAEQPCLPPQPLNVVFLGVGVATVGGHGAVAGIEAGLGAEILGRGGLDAAVLVVVLELGCVHRHQPRRLQSDP